MPQQTARRKGIQARKGRREMVADQRLANQFAQPVRRLEPRGTNLDSAMRTRKLNRPPRFRPQTRTVGGHTGMNKGIGGNFQQARGLSGMMTNFDRKSKARLLAEQALLGNSGGF